MAICLHVRPTAPVLLVQRSHTNQSFLVSCPLTPLTLQLLDNSLCLLRHRCPCLHVQKSQLPKSSSLLSVGANVAKLSYFYIIGKLMDFIINVEPVPCCDNCYWIYFIQDCTVPKVVIRTKLKMEAKQSLYD